MDTPTQMPKGHRGAPDQETSFKEPPATRAASCQRKQSPSIQGGGSCSLTGWVLPFLPPSPTGENPDSKSNGDLLSVTSGILRRAQVEWNKRAIRSQVNTITFKGLFKEDCGGTQTLAQQRVGVEEPHRQTSRNRSNREKHRKAGFRSSGMRPGEEGPKPVWEPPGTMG